MANIILHGALGKRFGKEHKFFVNKPIDAIRALMVNKKGFSHAVRTWGHKGWLYEIVCDGDLVEDEHQLLESKQINEIHIIPTIIGASNVFRIVLGAVLIVVGILLLPYGGIGKFFISLGVSLLIGGIMGILFPPAVPQFEASLSAKTFIFSALGNSATRGGPIKIGYGRLRVGSDIVSTALEPVRMGSQGDITRNRSQIIDYQDKNSTTTISKLRKPNISGGIEAPAKAGNQ